MIDKAEQTINGITREARRIKRELKDRGDLSKWRCGTALESLEGYVASLKAQLLETFDS